MPPPSSAGFDPTVKHGAFVGYNASATITLPTNATTLGTIKIAGSGVGTLNIDADPSLPTPPNIRTVLNQSPETHIYTLEEILYVAILFIVISVSMGLLFRGVFSHVRFAIGLRSCRLLDDQPAADRLTLQSLSQSDAAADGKLLLRFAGNSVPAKRSPTLGLISFASGKYLKQRVELLMRDSKPNGLPARFLSAGLVAAMIFDLEFPFREFGP